MRIERVTGAVGARITGVNLADCLDAATLGAISHALNDYGVVFFPGQPVLTADEHVRLTAQFGEVETPPFLTRQSEHPQVLIVEFERPKGSGADVWHQDGTHMEQPPRGTLLQAHVLPSFGGDTCFSCMYAAYEALSAPMRKMLDGLTALHTAQAMLANAGARNQYAPGTPGAKPPVSHPMVTQNPATGRRRLFVNSLYTSRIEGLSEPESSALLAMLIEHIKSPEFQLRYTWSVGDIAFWDNHAVQHYAVADYTERRRMQRVTLLGEKPMGLG
jgi:taurine dioxygenase